MRRSASARIIRNSGSTNAATWRRSPRTAARIFACAPASDRQSKPSMLRRLPAAALPTARPVFASTTVRAITPPSSATRTATASRRSRSYRQNNSSARRPRPGFPLAAEMIGMWTTSELAGSFGRQRLGGVGHRFGGFFQHRQDVRNLVGNKQVEIEPAADELQRLHVIEQGAKRPPEILDVGEQNRLPVPPKLYPGHLLDD